MGEMGQIRAAIGREHTPLTHELTSLSGGRIRARTDSDVVRTRE